ncbi:TIGR04222 domain-containing membrane protein [Kitasatospora sp. NBC_00458]|uniref:TIGR04222 domain-containing membrane protein n=1 Tax=Kitasatospora sp. NBC_00458 TaxID=2903568 RepID=UPI002E18207B
MGAVTVLFLAAIAVVGLNVFRAAAAVAGLRRAELAPRRSGFTPGTYELAYLAEHLAETAVAVMHQEGRLVASRSGTVTVTDPATAAETAVAAEATVILAAGPTRTRPLAELLADRRLSGWQLAEASPELRERLVASGLLRDQQLYARARAGYDSAPYAPVLVGLMGAVALWQADLHEGPLGLVQAGFGVLFAAALAVALWPRPKPSHTTELGRKVLARARASADGESPALVVALGGLYALPPDHPLAVARAAPPAPPEPVRRSAPPVAPPASPGPSDAPPGAPSDARPTRSDTPRSTGRQDPPEPGWGGVGTGGLGGGGCGGAGCGGGL